MIKVGDNIYVEYTAQQVESNWSCNADLGRKEQLFCFNHIIIIAREER